MEKEQEKRRASDTDIEKWSSTVHDADSTEAEARTTDAVAERRQVKQSCHLEHRRVEAMSPTG